MSTRFLPISIRLLPPKFAPSMLIFCSIPSFLVSPFFSKVKKVFLPQPSWCLFVYKLVCQDALDTEKGANIQYLGGCGFTLYNANEYIMVSFYISYFHQTPKKLILTTNPSRKTEKFTNMCGHPLQQEQLWFFLAWMKLNFDALRDSLLLCLHSHPHLYLILRPVFLVHNIFEHFQKVLNGV